MFGKISRVTTAEMVFESDDVIEVVAANIAANTSPTNPAGRNSRASIT